MSQSVNTTGPSLHSGNDAYLLSAIVDSSDDAIVSKDLSGVVTSWNQGAERLFGYSAQEAVGQSIISLIIPSDRIDEETVILSRLRNGERIRHFQTLRRRKDGSLLDVSLTISPVRNAEGQIIGASKIARDITAAKEAERQLQLSEERFRATFEQAAIGLAHVGLDGRWLRVNQRLCDIVGYTRDELLARRFSDITHPAYFEADAEQKAALLQGEISSAVLEKRYLRKDGEPVWVNVTVSLVHDAQRNPQYFITAVEDVQKHKAAEEALAQQARLLNLTEDPIFTWKLQGHIEYWNRGAELLYGWTQEEARGHVSHTLLRTKHPIPLPDVLRELEEKGYWKGTLTHTRRDGRTVIVDSQHLLTRGPDGEAIVLESNRDITEREQASQEIRRLAQTLEQRVRDRTTQLEAANRELQAFSYSVSHDLRAPLRSIEGFSNMLLRDYPDLFDARAKDLFGRIRANAVRMGELIEALLNLSRVSRGELNREFVDITSLASSVLSDYRERESKRNVTARVQSGMSANADEGLVRIVLDNLIGNAWKFTAKVSDPKIEVGCERLKGKDTFFVRDNGAGFDMEHSDQLFVPFHRLHRQSEFEGTGIGLATVARIVHRHGGDIWAQGRPGHGAVFYFTL